MGDNCVQKEEKILHIRERTVRQEMESNTSFSPNGALPLCPHTQALLNIGIGN